MTRASHSTHAGKSKPVRLAVLCSSGGGVLDALCQLHGGDTWPFEIVGVVTDQPCGVEHVAESHNVPLTRIDPAPMDTWSQQAAEAIQSWNANAVLLLILRKIGPAIWRDLDIPVWNLHPSLLPHYPGLHALERNFVDATHGAAFGHPDRMGVTIHVVTDRIDAGPIISQRYFTLQSAPTIEQAQHLCFLYKIALVLECICKHVDGTLPKWNDPHDPAKWHTRWQPFRPYEPLYDVMMRFAQPWARQWLESQLQHNIHRTLSKVVIRT